MHVTRGLLLVGLIQLKYMTIWLVYHHVPVPHQSVSLKYYKYLTKPRFLWLESFYSHTIAPYNKRLVLTWFSNEIILFLNMLIRLGKIYRRFRFSWIMGHAVCTHLCQCFKCHCWLWIISYVIAFVIICYDIDAPALYSLPLDRLWRRAQCCHLALGRYQLPGLYLQLHSVHGSLGPCPCLPY